MPNASGSGCIGSLGLLRAPKREMKTRARSKPKYSDLHVFVGNDLVLLLHSLLEAEEPPIDVAVGGFVVSRCRIAESLGIGLLVLILVHLCAGRVSRWVL